MPRRGVGAGVATGGVTVPLPAAGYGADGVGWATGVAGVTCAEDGAGAAGCVMVIA